ncbi:hypothetical protein FB451DRAFT_1567534 [Mycena latifolia]|nr:hypothetical protein FB451DRAFT_1567534 [Mycena latifolia]
MYDIWQNHPSFAGYPFRRLSVSPNINLQAAARRGGPMYDNLFFPRRLSASYPFHTLTRGRLLHLIICRVVRFIPCRCPAGRRGSVQHHLLLDCLVFVWIHDYLLPAVICAPLASYRRLATPAGGRSPATATTGPPLLPSVRVERIPRCLAASPPRSPASYPNLILPTIASQPRARSPCTPQSQSAQGAQERSPIFILYLLPSLTGVGRLPLSVRSATSLSHSSRLPPSYLRPVLILPILYNRTSFPSRSRPARRLSLILSSLIANWCRKLPGI